MDELRLPPHLDGSRGANRGTGVNQLGARDDLAAVRLFLAEYAGSVQTGRAYKKEIERLVLWAVLQRGRPLSSLDREDFLAYADFLRDPRPREQWCGPRGGRRGSRFSPGWRPFVGPLSPGARRTALVILNSLMTYLVQGGYLAGNPLSLMRQKRRAAHEARAAQQRVSRRCLDDVQWAALLDVVAGLPGAAPGDAASAPAPDAAAERVRFLLALLHFLALRVGEVTEHRMGDFAQVRGRWVFCVTGKGGKSAELPVNDDLLLSLRRYREGLGLPPLPTPGEETPLVPDRTCRQPLSARRINQLLKELLALAADRLAPRDPVRADHMRHASAHWFRHTSLTRQWQKGIPLTHIKENARHGKLDTTLLYVHTDEDERHEEARKLTWR